MYFKHKETGNVFECTDDVIDFLCAGEGGCNACPIWRETKVIRDVNCFSFAAKYPELLARLAGMEILESNPLSQPAADSSPAGGEPSSDPVNRPPHYTQGGIECIDAIKAAICKHPDPHRAFLTGQVIKYMWRWPFKVKPLEDLKKARWYLDKLIAEMEASDD